MNCELETKCLFLTAVLLDVFGTKSRNHRLSSLGFSRLVLNVSEVPRGALLCRVKVKSGVRFILGGRGRPAAPIPEAACFCTSQSTWDV